MHWDKPEVRLGDGVETAAGSALHWYRAHLWAAEKPRKVRKWSRPESKWEQVRCRPEECSASTQRGLWWAGVSPERWIPETAQTRSQTHTGWTAPVGIAETQTPNGPLVCIWQWRGGRRHTPKCQRMTGCRWKCWWHWFFLCDGWWCIWGRCSPAAPAPL